MKKLLLFVVVLLLRLSAFAQIPDTSKVEAWWPFCADYLDHKLHGYDLTNLTTAFLTADRFGSPASAVDFNGVDGGLTYSSVFYTSATQDFSYACWIYPRSNQNSVIIYNGNSNLDGFGLVMSNGAGAPGNQVGILFGGIGTFVNAPVTLNQWHHVAFTRNGNAYTLYIDSVNRGFTVQPFFNPLTNLFSVGFDNTDGSNYFDGIIDDIIYYKTKILGLSEVKQLARFNPAAITFSLGSDIALCVGSVTLSADVLFPPDYNYAWKDGPALISVSPTYTYSVPATYVPPKTFQLCVAKTLGCSFCDFVTVSHATYTVRLGADTAFCIGDSVNLRPNGGTGAIYSWSIPGVGDTNSVWVDTTGTYWITADSNGCVSKDTINILTSKHPIVNLGSDTSSCEGVPIVLSSTGATYYSPIYLWSNAATGATTTVTTSNLYWLKVTDMGCSSADTVNNDSIQVFIAYDTFTLHRTDTAICRGAQVKNIVVTGATGLTYQWTPTAGIPFGLDTSLTPTIVPDTSAWYVVTASVGTCHKSDSFYVDVQPYPLVYMGGNRHVCERDSIRLAPTVLPTWYNNYIYDWTPGYYLDDSTAATVRFTAGDTTKLILVVTTPAGCKGVDSMEVFTHLSNFVHLNTAYELCPKDTISLRPVADSNKYSEWPVTYAWIPAADFVDATDSIPLLNVNSSKNYIGVATSKWGCRDTMHVAMTVHPAATFYLDDSVTIAPGQSYHISPQTNAVIFHWSPGIGLSDTATSNPVATPPVNTKYQVTAITAQGCVVTDSIKIRVDAGTLVAVPNAFSPNGFNNRLVVLTHGEVALRFFRIYDRWGNMVFESTNISAGWDGNYKGTPAPMGVYVYDVEAVTDAGKLIHQRGNVTLLR